MLYLGNLQSLLYPSLEWVWCSVFFSILVCGYVVYYRYLHPLSQYPGPFLASLTKLWKVYHFTTLHLSEKLVQVHEQYGEVVRVGPNELSFRTPQALAPIYKSGGRNMPKTKFYNGFTTFLPNLFGTQDEDVRFTPEIPIAFSVNTEGSFCANFSTGSFSPTQANGACLFDDFHPRHGSLHGQASPTTIG